MILHGEDPCRRSGVNFIQPDSMHCSGFGFEYVTRFVFCQIVFLSGLLQLTGATAPGKDSDSAEKQNGKKHYDARSQVESCQQKCPSHSAPLLTSDALKSAKFRSPMLLLPSHHACVAGRGSETWENLSPQPQYTTGMSESERRPLLGATSVISEALPTRTMPLAQVRFSAPGGTESVSVSPTALIFRTAY